MTKQILKAAIVLTVFAATCNSAFAGVPVPDTASTSLLLAAAVGGLGLVRKFIR